MRNGASTASGSRAHAKEVNAYSPCRGIPARPPRLNIHQPASRGRVSVENCRSGREPVLIKRCGCRVTTYAGIIRQRIRMRNYTSMLTQVVICKHIVICGIAERVAELRKQFATGPVTLDMKFFTVEEEPCTRSFSK